MLKEYVFRLHVFQNTAGYDVFHTDHTWETVKA